MGCWIRELYYFWYYSNGWRLVKWWQVSKQHHFSLLGVWVPSFKFSWWASVAEWVNRLNLGTVINMCLCFEDCCAYHLFLNALEITHKLFEFKVILAFFPHCPTLPSSYPPALIPFPFPVVLKSSLKSIFFTAHCVFLSFAGNHQTVSSVLFY